MRIQKAGGTVRYGALFLNFTVPKFGISQSEAKSTALISYNIKSLNLGMVNT